MVVQEFGLLANKVDVDFRTSNSLDLRFSKPVRITSKSMWPVFLLGVFRI